MKTTRLLSVQGAAADVALALDRRSLGYEPLHLVQAGKQVVFRTRITARNYTAAPYLAGTPDGSRPIAARVVAAYRGAADAANEHEIVATLAQRGAPVARPLHRRPIHVRGSALGLWEWADQNRTRPMDIRAWAAALREIHDAGAGVVARAHDPFHAIRGRAPLLRDAVRDPGHPLHGRGDIVAALFDAVRSAQQRIEAAPEAGRRTIVHGDWHPANAKRVAGGRIVAFDFEHAGTGRPAADFAVVALGIRRYGWPALYMDEFRIGYGDDAPADVDIAPFLRARELSHITWSLLHASRSREHHHEMLLRVAAIHDELAGAPWTHVGSRGAMEAGVLIRPNPLSQRPARQPAGALR